MSERAYPAARAPSARAIDELERSLRASRVRPVILLPRTEPPRGVALVRAQRELAARALSRSALASGVVLGEVAHDALGAPLSTNGWHTSTAHTRGLACAVVHDAPVGIDVERIETRKPELAEWIVSPEEERLVGGRSPLALALAWTAKEAALKRAGVGLAELSLCRVVERAADAALLVRYRGVLLRVDQLVLAEHVVALCTGGETTDGPSHDIPWTVAVDDGRDDH